MCVCVCGGGGGGLDKTMKFRVMDVIFCTNVVTGIVSNLKSSLS